MIFPPDAKIGLEIGLKTTLFLDHPSEPMLVIAADGGWSIMFAAEVDMLIKDEGGDFFHQAIPLKALFEDFDRHMTRHDEIFRVTQITSDGIQEALDLIVEECGEVVVAVSKLRRFGPDNRDPAKPETPNNWEAVKLELLDVHTLIGRLITRSVILHGESLSHKEQKLANTRKLHPNSIF